MAWVVQYVILDKVVKITVDTDWHNTNPSSDSWRHRIECIALKFLIYYFSLLEDNLCGHERATRETTIKNEEHLSLWLQLPTLHERKWSCGITISIAPQLSIELWRNYAFIRNLLSKTSWRRWNLPRYNHSVSRAQRTYMQCLWSHNTNQLNTYFRNYWW